MKKENLIIIFYILYFGWLMSIVYLARQPVILDYFTVTVALFYFAFLREEWDLFWFLLGSVLVIFTVMSSFYNGIFQINLNSFLDIPPWLPLSWGTTFVALRKFFIIISRKGDRLTNYS
jgi:hypothetical protein